MVVHKKRKWQNKPKVNQKENSLKELQNFLSSWFEKIELGEAELADWKKPWASIGAGTAVASGRPYQGDNAWVASFFTHLKGYNSNHWITFNRWKAFNEILADEDAGKINFKQQTVKEKRSIKILRPILKTKKDASGKVITDDNGTPKKILIGWGSDTVFNLDEFEGADGFEITVDEINRLNEIYCKKKGFEKGRKLVGPTAANYETDKEQEFEDAFEFIARLNKLNSGDTDFIALDEAAAPRAAYSRKTNKIYMPAKDKFASVEAYLSTLFHEITHSTGHKKINDRPAHKSYGDGIYAREELIAEIGSMMLCQRFGVQNTGNGFDFEESSVVNQSLSYIASWKKDLDTNPNFVQGVISDAEAAVKYVLNFTGMALELSPETRKREIKHVEKTKTFVTVK